MWALGGSSPPQLHCHYLWLPEVTQCPAPAPRGACVHPHGFTFTPWLLLYALVASLITV